MAQGLQNHVQIAQIKIVMLKSPSYRISTPIVSTLALAVSLLVLSALAPGTAQAQRLVTVQGEGVLSVEPDHAIVSFGIATLDKDPENARAKNAKASADAMNQVRALGIDERLIKMEQLRIQPRRRYDQRQQTWIEEGFEAVRDVSVKVEDLDQLPTLISRIVQNGANRLSGVAYDIRDREGAKREALRLGALNARAKAQLLAETLGARLGQVVQINEGNVFVPRPTYRMDEMAVSARSLDAAPEPAAYASGEIEVRATVTVVFELVSPPVEGN
ncbi:MAG: hypothetical protein ACI80V_003297 [Rhodothermales bacterium]